PERDHLTVPQHPRIARRQVERVDVALEAPGGLLEARQDRHRQGTATPASKAGAGGREIFLLGCRRRAAEAGVALGKAAEALDQRLVAERPIEPVPAGVAERWRQVGSQRADQLDGAALVGARLAVLERQVEEQPAIRRHAAIEA